jgi:hypothetical protein
MDFVVCTLAVKKKNQGRFRYVESDHSLVSSVLVRIIYKIFLNIIYSNISRAVFSDDDRTNDNAQEYKICTNVPPSQTLNFIWNYLYCFWRLMKYELSHKL